MNPERWPFVLEDSTSRCVLELRAWERAAAIPLKHVSQRKPGQTLSARYLCMQRGWREPHYAGPLYSWTRDGRLDERTYRSTDGTRYREDIYQYRANGLVCVFRRRERGEDLQPPSTMMDEYFEPSGELAGFQIETVTEAGGDTTAVRWWRGASVDGPRFQRQVAAFGR